MAAAKAASCGPAAKPRAINCDGVTRLPSGGAVALVAPSTRAVKSVLASTACSALLAWANTVASPLWLAWAAKASALPIWPAYWLALTVIWAVPAGSTSTSWLLLSAVPASATVMR